MLAGAECPAPKPPNPPPVPSLIDEATTEPSLDVVPTTRTDSPTCKARNVLVSFLVTVVDADVVTVRLAPDRMDMTIESPLTPVTVPDAKPPPGPARPGPNPGRPLPPGGLAPSGPEVGLGADIGPISVMRVAVIVDPDVAPVTEMRSPLAIELTPTVFATVTRVALDVSTLTAVFDPVSSTVSTLPAIDAIVPNVPGRPGPPNPSPAAGVDVPLVADALAFVPDNAFAPKNPPTTSTNTPAPEAHPTHPGRCAADRDRGPVDGDGAGLGRNISRLVIRFSRHVHATSVNSPPASPQPIAGGIDVNSL